MDGPDLCGETAAIALAHALCEGALSYCRVTPRDGLFVCNGEESLGRSPAPQ